MATQNLNLGFPTVLFPISTAANAAGNVAASKQYVDDAVANAGGGGNTVIVPAIYFQANASGNGQQFVDARLTAYGNNASAVTVFYNGALLQNDLYSVSGNTLTINTYINTGDQIDLARSVASNASATPIPGPQGAAGSLQFNANGNFGGISSTSYANGVLSLGNIGNLSIGGGISGQVLSTDGNGVLAWANNSGGGGAGAGVEIPAIYFVAQANANNQAFQSPVLELYDSANAITMFVNGALQENTTYDLNPSTGVLTVNLPLRQGDTVDVVRSINVANGIVVPAVYFVAANTGPGQIFSNAYFNAYNSAREMTVYVDGALLENTDYVLNGSNLVINTSVAASQTVAVSTATISGNGVYPLGTGVTVSWTDSNGSPTSQNFVNNIIAGGGLTVSGNVANGSVTLNSGSVNVPYIHFDVTEDGNNQEFTNVYLQSYPSNTDMSLFRNGVLVQPTDYTLDSTNGTVTLNTIAYSGDSIDIAKSSIAGGNLNVIDPSKYTSVVTVSSNTFTPSPSNQVLLVANSSNTVITIPQKSDMGGNVGKTLIIKDIVGAGRQTNPLVLLGEISSGVTIDGQSSITITQGYNSVTLMITGSNTWGII